mgnify:CR=1 FL=1
MKKVIAAKSSRKRPSPKVSEATTKPPVEAPRTSQATPVPPSAASIVGPNPNRALRGVTAPAATREPTPASMKSSPTWPAEKPSSRAAKRITTAT